MANVIIRLPDVTKKTGLPRSSIYLALREGTFPRPIKISERSIGFVESEIDEWVDKRIAESREGGAAA